MTPSPWFSLPPNSYTKVRFKVPLIDNNSGYPHETSTLSSVKSRQG